MKTIGSLLFEARQERGISLSALAAQTKIREEYLRAIEQDEFSTVPQGPFVRGFIASYAMAVGLNAKNAVAIYRRDFGSLEKPRLLPKGVEKPLRKKRWVVLHPQLVALGILAVIILVFIGVQWSSFYKPPMITSVEPQDNAQLQSPILVKGKTTTDVLVQINTVPVVLNQEGEFQTILPFSLGEHMIVIEAKNKQGKSTLIQRTVNVIQ